MNVRLYFTFKYSGAKGLSQSGRIKYILVISFINKIEPVSSR